MKNVKLFTLLFLATTLFWYTSISFIEWDFKWIDILPSLSYGSRFIFFIGILIKITIDIWAWYYIKEKFIDIDLEEKAKREKAEQDKLKEKFN